MIEHRFLEHLEELYQEHKVGSGPLHPLRTHCLQKCLQMELPFRKAEKFRYFPFKEFYLQKFSELTTDVLLSPHRIEEEMLPECQGARIVMVNGRLCPELCNLEQKIVLLPVEKAAYSYEMLLAGRYQKLLAKETDPFILMNGAFNREGGFLYIPPKTRCAKPIQILHFIMGKEGSVGVLHPQWHIFVGKESEVSFVQTYHFLKSHTPLWINQAMEISLEEGARASYLHKADLEEEHYLFSSTKITQKQDSRSTFISITNGSIGMRQQIDCSLLGEGAETDLSGIWDLSESRHAHTVCQVRHEAPHTTSNQLFKGILRDKSISSFEGKIFVDAIAQQTMAYQLNKNLILGEEAKAYTKPNLEIFADDVKASHGATVGYFSEEELFYLAARGIGKEEATKLLTTSFIQDILNKIHEARLPCS